MKRSWSLILLLLFLLAGGLTFAVNLYSDWLWFSRNWQDGRIHDRYLTPSASPEPRARDRVLFPLFNLWLANRGPGYIEINIPTSDGNARPPVLPGSDPPGGGVISLVDCPGGGRCERGVSVGGDLEVAERRRVRLLPTPSFRATFRFISSRSRSCRKSSA